MSIDFRIFAHSDDSFQNESIQEEILKFTKEHVQSIKNDLSLKLLRENLDLLPMKKDYLS